MSDKSKIISINVCHDGEHGFGGDHICVEVDNKDVKYMKSLIENSEELLRILKILCKDHRSEDIFSIMELDYMDCIVEKIIK